MLDAREQDFVAVAERFVGAPHLWGGKTALGIDCSGLVQIALNAAGVGCSRDRDMQEQALGRALSESESKKLQRGDLIFWDGHSRFVRDAGTTVHAQRAPVENTSAAIACIRLVGSEVTSIKRLRAILRCKDQHLALFGRAIERGRQFERPLRYCAIRDSFQRIGSPN